MIPDQQPTVLRLYESILTFEVWLTRTSAQSNQDFTNRESVSSSECFQKKYRIKIDTRSHSNFDLLHRPMFIPINTRSQVRNPFTKLTLQIRFNLLIWFWLPDLTIQIDHQQKSRSTFLISISRSFIIISSWLHRTIKESIFDKNLNEQIDLVQTQNQLIGLESILITGDSISDKRFHEMIDQWAEIDLGWSKNAQTTIETMGLGNGSWIVIDQLFGPD